MTGLTQLVNTGLSGLDAAGQALATVSNNTANVNTPGYDVEGIRQAAIPGAPGSVGGGTQVTSIQRAFDQIVFSQMVGATSSNQAAQVAQSNAQNLAAIFPIASGGASGLGAAMTSLFSAMNGIAQDPASLTNRGAFLAQAQALASDFNSVGSQLAGSLTMIDGQMSAAVGQINALTRQIAGLNRQIMTQSAPGGGAAPNALMDSRDNLIQQLGQELGVKVIAGSGNSLDVYTLGGAVLVDGGTSANLVVSSGSYGGNAMSIAYQPNGQDITTTLSGGTIGGLVSSQAQAVAAQNSVGGLAAALAAGVNARQSLGLDLNGALGRSLFSIGGPNVLAAASNTGGGSLVASITDSTAFVPGNFVVTKTSGGYEASDTATGNVTVLGSGPSLSFDGMTLAVSGTINTGDSFLVEPTATAAQTLRVTTSDPRAVAAGAAYVATPGNNRGGVAASASTPAASGSLAAGAAIVPAADFGQSLTVKFTSATSFDVLSASNAVVASGTFSAANGGQVAIAYPAPTPAGQVAVLKLSPGTAAAGDTFSLTPGGPSSGGNIVGMTDLANQSLLSGQTLNGSYAALVAQVGSAGQAASLAAQAAQGVLAQVQAVQQSISGVNLDEQAADLVSYQQAYQASAQIIASAQVLFQGLIAAVQAG
ncbi:MAG: flagellar hook-associated protein FlgK [Alphaproteobacteria bacterium]|nr:flagellar hook-associated protein FlgK [Alphaproteobacteria bacterium]